MDSAVTPLVRKWQALLGIDRHEMDFLEKLEARQSHCDKQQELVRQGEPARKVYILRDGWAIRYKTLPDGRRQVINFAIPGDLVGFPSAALTSAHHTIETLTPDEAGESEPSHLLELFRDFPRLASALIWSAAYDYNLQAEHIVRLGCLSARERVANFFIELHGRLRVVGLASEDGFEFPGRQTHIAELLGVTPAYVNHVLKDMRQDELLEVRGGAVRIKDYDSLLKLSKFSPIKLRHVPVH